MGRVRDEYTYKCIFTFLSRVMKGHGTDNVPLDCLANRNQPGLAISVARWLYVEEYIPADLMFSHVG